MIMSKEQKEFLKKLKKNKRIVLFIQVLLVISFLVIWELLSDYNVINSFIFSSPIRVIKTIISYRYSLLRHIGVSIYETIMAFCIGLLISFIISLVLYTFPNVYKIFDPFLTCINSLPKVALGPMILIICGANQRSIIVMAILINVIVSTIVITNGFYSTSSIKIKLMKSLKANRFQILRYLVIPSSYSNIISSFKLNISMSLIGVISGEFLVSKEGLGYLIIYGTQVFNLDLVITGIFLLIIISYMLYRLVYTLERKIIK